MRSCVPCLVSLSCIWLHAHAGNFASTRLPPRPHLTSRRSIAHAPKFADEINSRTLAARVCSDDPGLEGVLFFI